MTAIEIHLDGKPVTKLEAARAAATLDGPSVVIGEPGPDGWIKRYISVYARHRTSGGIQRPALHCAAFIADTTAEIRQQAEMTALAAEIAELAEMLAAEQPGTLPGWTEEEDGDGRRWRTALADGRTAVIERLDDDRSFLPKVHESAGEYEAGPVAYSAAAAAAWCVLLAAEPEPAKAHVHRLACGCGAVTLARYMPGTVWSCDNHGATTIEGLAGPASATDRA